MISAVVKVAAPTFPCVQKILRRRSVMNMRFLPFAVAAAFATFIAPDVEAQLPAATEVAPGHLPRADVEFILGANSANITQIAMGHAADDQGAKPGIHSLGNRIDTGLRALI